MPTRAASVPAAIIALAGLALGGCVQTSSLLPAASAEERDCLARAMYFESNRSSEDGMLAVGTVVMNRAQSSKYPKTICAVVAQDRQFAAGVMTKPAEGRSFELARKVADGVLTGDRHDEVGAAVHFHTAGYTFPYRNMAYVSKAGGNVFYEKKEPGTFKPVKPHTLIAREDTPRPSTSKPTRLASADPAEDAAVPTPQRQAEGKAERLPLPPIREARADRDGGVRREASAGAGRREASVAAD